MSVSTFRKGGGYADISTAPIAPGTLSHELVDKVNDLCPGELIDFVNELARGMDRNQDLTAMAEAFRRFNRFYMRQIRPLRDAMRGPGLHASYVRVLREIGESPAGTTATSIAHRLNMDPSLVCRILGWFRALGYLTESKDPDDGRRKIVRLSPAGQDNYGRLQARAGDTAEFMLMLLHPADRARLLAALATIETVLRGVRWDDIRPPPS